MHAVIHAADIQDRDGGVLVMANLFGLLSPQALCRWRLSGAAVSGRAMPCHEAGQRGDREAVRYREGIRGSTQTLDRREDHRLAKPVQKVSQGLGMPEPQRPRIPALGLHPAHAAKALQKNKMIPDRLLEDVRAGANPHKNDGRFASAASLGER